MKFTIRAYFENGVIIEYNDVVDVLGVINRLRTIAYHYEQCACDVHINGTFAGSIITKHRESNPMYQIQGERHD